jgi:hypothetical protein
MGRRLLMSIPNILRPTSLVFGTGSDPPVSGVETGWRGYNFFRISRFLSLTMRMGFGMLVFDR